MVNNPRLAMHFATRQLSSLWRVAVLLKRTLWTGKNTFGSEWKSKQFKRAMTPSLPTVARPQKGGDTLFGPAHYVDMEVITKSGKYGLTKRDPQLYSNKIIDGYISKYRR